MQEISQAADKTQQAMLEHTLQLKQEASQAVAAKTQQWAQAEERAARIELELQKSKADAEDLRAKLAAEKDMLKKQFDAEMQQHRDTLKQEFDAEMRT